MKKLPKIPVSNLSEVDLEKLRKKSVEKARAIYRARPFVTKVWMAMQHKFPMAFLTANWEEIIKNS